jgi:hypothetical protein
MLVVDKAAEVAFEAVYTGVVVAEADTLVDSAAVDNFVEEAFDMEQLAATRMEALEDKDTLLEVEEQQDNLSEGNPISVQYMAYFVIV